MAAIATTADGIYIYLAVEISTFPAVVRTTKANKTVWETVYQPGAGTACNVIASLANADTMFFYGNFGTDVGVIKHTVSTLANTDISPASIGTREINTFDANPSNEDELNCTINSFQDLEHTTDGGITWTDWDAALGVNPTGLWVLRSGEYFPDRYFMGGNNGEDLDIEYSPNEGQSETNVEGATIDLLANISNLEATEA